MKTCAHCEETKPKLHARGLCPPCYMYLSCTHRTYRKLDPEEKAYRREVFAGYARKTKPREHVLEDLTWMVETGETLAGASRRLGLPEDYLRKILTDATESAQ